MLNDFQIVMLASGSKGNAALISTAKQRFLVELQSVDNENEGNRRQRKRAGRRVYYT